MPNQFYYHRNFYFLPQLSTDERRALECDPDKVVRQREDNSDVSTIVSTRLSRRKGKEVTGWKKCSYRDKHGATHSCIVELLIPAKAKRQQCSNEKCRASSARVVRMYEIVHGKLGAPLPKRTDVRSQHDRKFKYRIGQTVRPKGRPYSTSIQECASGIHFFLTKREALGY